jgi:hypothetical protein
MAKFPVLPLWVGSRDGWGASLHLVQSPKKGSNADIGPIEAIVISQEIEGVVKLKGLRFQSPSAITLKVDKEKGPIRNAPAPWLKAVVTGYAEFPDMDSIAAREHLNSRTFRNLLTGHILAYRFFDLLVARHSLADTPVSVKGMSIRFDLPARPKESLTKTTSRIFKELQEWGESTPAWLIAQIEGVAVNTIYARLNEGRKKELLAKPGKGARKSHK